MRIVSVAVFSSQFNLNNTDGEATNRIIPITITSNDKIVKATVAEKPFYDPKKKLASS